MCTVAGLGYEVQCRLRWEKGQHVCTLVRRIQEGWEEVMQASESTTAGARSLSDKGGRDMGTSRTGLRGLLFMCQGKWTFLKTLGLVLWPGFWGMGGGQLGQDPHQPLRRGMVLFLSTSLSQDNSSWSQEVIPTLEAGDKKAAFIIFIYIHSYEYIYNCLYLYLYLSLWIKSLYLVSVCVSLWKNTQETRKLDTG